MQYIQKQNTEPNEWGKWFEAPPNRRSYDYGQDYSALRNINEALKYLILEQHGLCAYCQQKITEITASIEHVFPKSFNKELSTNYFNLVAVCTVSKKETKVEAKHCDVSKSNKFIVPLIFHNHCDVNDSPPKSNPFFSVNKNGTLSVKPDCSSKVTGVEQKQIQQFLETLNLNASKGTSAQESLVERRAKIFEAFLETARSLTDKHHQERFWEYQFDKALKNKETEFRQAILAFIAPKLKRYRSQ